MRQAKTGSDPYTDGIAYLAARVLFVKSKADTFGANRGQQREIEALELLLDRLADIFPPSTMEQARALAHDHHEYTQARWGAQ